MTRSRSTVSRPASGPETRIAGLASGGLDSCVMLVELAKTYQTVYPLYVQCGLPWEKEEMQALRRFLGEVRNPVIHAIEELRFQMTDLYGQAWYASGVGVPGYHEPDERWEIPGRNISLLTKAAIWCRLRSVGHVALGVLGSNPFPDATPQFFGTMQEALSLGLGTSLVLHRPFSGLHKADVVRLGRDLPLHLALSCASPVQGVHCGRCGKCRERIDAFAAAGLKDPTTYAASS
jgi:7-cyano-7-deazaguanine synthase